MVANPDTTSVITLINNVDATTYIIDTALAVSMNQDPDTAYNAIFFTSTSSDTRNSDFFRTSG